MFTKNEKLLIDWLITEMEPDDFNQTSIGFDGDIVVGKESADNDTATNLMLCGIASKKALETALDGLIGKNIIMTYDLRRNEFEDRKHFFLYVDVEPLVLLLAYNGASELKDQNGNRYSIDGVTKKRKSLVTTAKI